MKINSRAKGAAAERELIGELRDLLGDEIAGSMKRNLEQSRRGGHDIAGLPGWAIEVKHYKTISESEIAKIWERQAVSQAWKVQARPALAYKANYRPWRVRLPMSLLRDHDCDWKAGDGYLYIWTADIGLEAFASIVREVHCSLLLQDIASPKIIET